VSAIHVTEYHEADKEYYRALLTAGG